MYNRDEEFKVTYMSPPQDTVFGHHGPDDFGMFLGHVFSIFFFSEPGLTVSTDGETKEFSLLKGSICW